MFIDAQNEFDPSGTAITVTANSTAAIDLGVGRDLGRGEELAAVINITETFVGAGASLQTQLQAAPDNGSGAAGTYATVVQSDAIGVANLAAGGRVVLRLSPMPPQGSPVPRFLRLHYVVVGGPFTGGKVQASLTTGVGGYQAYAANIPAV
jgi:hypothetical protein